MTKIILDAGHGPNTAGKRSPDGKLKEFIFNHAVVLELSRLLQGENIEIITTAKSTHDVSLNERIQRANAANGDLFISIHANAFSSGWHQANGIETYIQKNPSKREEALAKHVQQSLVYTTGLRDRGIKQENFAVLLHTKMPSILVECGFMTNKQEAKLIAASSFQKNCAIAIFRGVIAYLENDYSK